MNIFKLDESPVVSAKYACDKHVVKMILESAQMLCSVHPEGTAPYKRSFYNHPCTKWVRESARNYEWLLLHAYALCDEYTNRYGKIHKTEKVIEWCDTNRPELPYTVHTTKQPTCMPDYCKTESVVESYRKYYINEKAKFAKWKDGNIPFWFIVE
tara:strand:+ start:109 stop:573 length:465 start_codon:yes stop_codon:yes gene_type:complete